MVRGHERERRRQRQRRRDYWRGRGRGRGRGEWSSMMEGPCWTTLGLHPDCLESRFRRRSSCWDVHLDGCSCGRRSCCLDGVLIGGPISGLTNQDHPGHLWERTQRGSAAVLTSSFIRRHRVPFFPLFFLPQPTGYQHDGHVIGGPRSTNGEGPSRWSPERDDRRSDRRSRQWDSSPRPLLALGLRAWEPPGGRPDDGPTRATPRHP